MFSVTVCFGKRFAAILKRVSHVFFSLIIRAAAIRKSMAKKNLYVPLLRAASFMVNKTSTIKRIASQVKEFA